MTYTPRAVPVVVPDLKVDARQHLLHALDQVGWDVPCTWNPEQWFTDNRYRIHDAAAACLTCPVLAACGQYADTEPAEQWGIWGGRNRSRNANRSPA